MKNKNIWIIYLLIVAIAGNITWATEQRTITVKITAHCPDKCCCGKYAGQNTLFGENPWETSGVAARRDFLPTGRVLEIPDVGIRIVDSFGGRKVNEKEKKQGIQGVISLRMESHKKAKKFGVKILKVKILGNIKIDNASEIAPGAIVLMEVSGYCSCEKCCGPNACGLTTTGKNSWKTLGVAADLNLLPPGTKLKIPTVGERIVDDSGGDMRKNAKKGICHIDVRYGIPDEVEICPEEIKKCHQQAISFGRKYLKIEILELKK